VLGDDPSAGPELDGIVGLLEAAARDGDRVSIDALLARAVPGFSPALRPWDIKV
jgi:hypothetical protein